MSHPKVSVIIPVYNTENYLREAIESIMNQTLREIEILIVNDGSTDRSRFVINELAARDKRITVFNQENKGLSEARNRAIPHIAGEYVYFMDSDDFLESDCLEKCYKRCKEQQLDFVFFDAENKIEKEVNVSIQSYIRKGQLDESRIYVGQKLLEEQIHKNIFRSSVWLSFVRVDFMRMYFTRFYPGILHEDHLFTIPLYLFANRVGYIARTFFKHRIRSNSIMSKPFSMRNLRGYMVTVSEISACYKAQYPVVQLYLKRMLNAVVWEAHKVSLADKIFFFKWLLKEKYIRDISFRNILVFWLK